MYPDGRQGVTPQTSRFLFLRGTPLISVSRKKRSIHTIEKYTMHTEMCQGNIPRLSRFFCILKIIVFF